MVELGTGLLFVLIFLFGGLNILTIFLSLVSIPLLIIFIFDWKNYLIPEKIVYPTLGFVLLFWLSLDLYQKHPFVLPSSHFFSSLMGLGVFGGFLGLLYLLTKGKGMGLGDVELGLLLGAILGWPVSLVSLFLSFLIGAILGLALIVFHKKGWKSQVPFGPFLVLGTEIGFIWGNQLIHWGLSLLL